METRREATEAGAGGEPRAAELEIDAAGRVRRACGDPGHPMGRPELVGLAAAEIGVPCRHRPEAAARERQLSCGSRDVAVWTDGEGERTLLWSCEALQDDQGDFRGCLARCFDLGPRGPLELQLFQAKHEIEAVFDSIVDPTILVDEEFRVRRANRALAVRVGLTFPQILGRPLLEVLGSLAGEGVLERLREAVESGAVAQDEVRAPDGAICKLHFFPLLRQGRFRQVVVRIQDVTAERRLEERLLQSERMASIGQLATGIAHEINNPMGFIAWNLSRLGGYLADLKVTLAAARDCAGRVLAGEAGGQEALARCVARWEEDEVEFLLEDSGSLVDECRTGADRVQEIIRSLRAYGHPGAAWERADLRACLDDAIRVVWNQLKYSCELRREYGEIHPVRCQPQRLAQVFVNLLVNAAQAMPAGGVVTVGVRSAEGRVGAWVADSGVGIVPENLRRIFDPFFTTKPMGQGTGLGLHIALEIAREHGGEIEVESAPGRGTTFTLWLPQQRAAAEPSAGSGAPQGGERSRPPPAWATA